MDNIKVYVGDQLPDVIARFPESFFLKNNIWNDFSYLTTYRLYYIDDGKKSIDIGDFKVAKKGLESLQRPLGNGLISEVSEDYFSLGQDKSLYTYLKELPNNLGEKFLILLRDISFDRSIWLKNKKEEVLEKSLFRDLTKMDAISFQALFQGKGGKLEYCLTINNGQSLNFNINHSLPFKNSNIHAIIGNNGVGKTTFLKEIAKNIVERNFTCRIINNKAADLEEGIDIDYIERVLFVSFSAFDNSRLDFMSRSRFDYLGLHNDEGGFKGPEVLSQEFEESLMSLINSKQTQYIENVFEPLRNVDYLEEHIEYFFNNIGDIPKIVTMYKKLSSGHRIVLHSLVLLMDTLHQGVVTLFDEPETHLHPPLLGAFLQSLQTICNEYNGLLILATHSPIILQEVLSENTLVLRRIDGEVSHITPDVVTYGQNVSKLTRTAFGYQKVGFHKTIRDLVDNKTITKDNLSSYDNLGSEAKKVALSILHGREDV